MTDRPKRRKRRAGPAYFTILRQEWGPKDPLWQPRRPRTRLEAYIDLHYLAAWKDVLRETERGQVPQRRGEVLASLRTLAKRWAWSTSKAQRFLDRLQKRGRLTVLEATQAGTLYRVEGYGVGGVPTAATDTPSDTPSDTRAKHSRDAGETLARQEEAVSKQVRTNQEAFINHSPFGGKEPARDEARAKAPRGQQGEIEQSSIDQGALEAAVERMAELWRGIRGEVEPADVSRYLAPCVARHGEEAVDRAIRYYHGEESPDTEKFRTLRNFAACCKTCIEDASFIPLREAYANDDGEDDGEVDAADLAPDRLVRFDHGPTATDKERITKTYEERAAKERAQREADMAVDPGPVWRATLAALAPAGADCTPKKAAL